MADDALEGIRIAMSLYHAGGLVWEAAEDDRCAPPRRILDAKTGKPTQLPPGKVIEGQVVKPPLTETQD